MASQVRTGKPGCPGFIDRMLLQVTQEYSVYDKDEWYFQRRSSMVDTLKCLVFITTPVWLLPVLLPMSVFHPLEKK